MKEKTTKRTLDARYPKMPFPGRSPITQEVTWITISGTKINKNNFHAFIAIPFTEKDPSAYFFKNSLRRQ